MLSDSNSTIVAVATSDGARHLLAWWRQGAAQRLEAVLDQGVRSFRDALGRLRTVDVDVPADRVRNLNTPTDVDPRG